ncbi:hypothetical protein CLV98_104115 [Dyadobacter jejuensis]|uniref:Uncharacterized protein n=1 Tax=Dyadobacter jejuensis TaxID=1082580 RepID=A0A316B6T0_9BACT|nr:hypothetical protein [Dyadobacter jejuensis]PWJ58257.1 hypothetical protein CLV98_104115 [Dyadobacter jejuensis]
MLQLNPYGGSQVQKAWEFENARKTFSGGVDSARYKVTELLIIQLF